MPAIETGGVGGFTPTPTYTPGTGIFSADMRDQLRNDNPAQAIAGAVATGVDLVNYANGKPSKFGTQLAQLKAAQSAAKLAGTQSDAALAAGLPAKQAAAAGTTADLTSTTGQAELTAGVPAAEAQGALRTANAAGVTPEVGLTRDANGNYLQTVTPMTVTPEGATLGSSATLPGVSPQVMSALRTTKTANVIDADSDEGKAAGLPAGSGSYQQVTNGLGMTTGYTRLAGQLTANNKATNYRQAENNGVDTYQRDPQGNPVVDPQTNQPLRKSDDQIAHEWSMNKDPNLLKDPAFSGLDAKDQVKALGEADSLRQEPQYQDVSKSLALKNKMAGTLASYDTTKDPAIQDRTLIDLYTQQATGKAVTGYNANSFQQAQAIPDRIKSFTTNFWDPKTGAFDTSGHSTLQPKDREAIVTEFNNNLDATSKAWGKTYDRHADALRPLGYDPDKDPQATSNLFKAIHPADIQGDLSYGSVKPNPDAVQATTAQGGKGTAPAAASSVPAPNPNDPFNLGPIPTK